jgi:hypothetical protein
MIPKHVGQWHEPHGDRRTLELAELPHAVIKDAKIVSVREKMPVLKDGQGGIHRGDDGCGARQDKSMGLAHDGSEPGHGITALYGMKGARW